MFFITKHRFTQQNRAWADITSIALAGLATACTPAMNWREVRFDNSPVTALLPCKPDRATRSLPLAGVPRDMVMMGCEAGGAMFTVAYADVGSATRIDQAIAEWKTASKATQAVYQFHGTQVVQAAVYGTPNAASDGPGVLSSQAVETFLSGLTMPTKP
jgi:hypothetical protein